MADIEWKKCRDFTKRMNLYFHYPKDDNDFKSKVVENDGWIAHIYKNNIFIDKIEAKTSKTSKLWKSSIFTQIKTSTKNGVDIEQIYENCKIYAVPKGYEDMLPPRETNTHNKPIQKEDSSQNKGDTMNNQTKTPPLNQILYGPPGTGKTYSTIDKALEILRHYDKTIQIRESREDKRKIFDKYRANKQIEFVTFHQSFSYEEFVEGIKPKLIDSSEGAESSEMSYTIKSGIFKEICKSALDEQTKPYILIIDEINRGNISKILGELITLIEPSKRIGANDEEKARGIGNESLEVTLPYSNDSFGVPSNLYIIGTMNTADRSIALLDTALRRRFEFVEMMPEWDNEHISTDCEGVNLQELLKSMNERIEFLLDREHTIGHSFFIEVDSLSELREAFKLKIIPLLQEYFYDDYAKIQAVLNDNGMVESKSMSDLGVNLSDEFVDSDKNVYRITNSSAWNATTFTKIYE